MVGLEPKNTALQSPESNGIAESFVKTMKRDYISIMPKSDGLTAAKNFAEAQNSRCFTMMKWISTSIPKSARAGSYAGNKSALSHWVRMKSTILPMRCTVVRAKSATWVDTVKANPCLSGCYTYTALNEEPEDEGNRSGAFGLRMRFCQYDNHRFFWKWAELKTLTTRKARSQKRHIQRPLI